jgi:hypothetical protein
MKRPRIDNYDTLPGDQDQDYAPSGSEEDTTFLLGGKEVSLPVPLPALPLKARVYESSSIIQLDSLKPICMVVDRHVIICTLCRFAVKRKDIRGHVRRRHRSLIKVLPDQESLDKALDKGEVSKTPIIRSLSAEVPPLPHIPVLSGFRCAVADCVCAFPTCKSLLKNHFAKRHRGLKNQVKWTKKCRIQMVYTSPKIYWAVNLDTSTIFDADPLRMEAVQNLMAVLESVDDDGTIQPPPSENHLTPFLAASGWASLCLGKHIVSVIDLGRSATEDDENFRLFRSLRRMLGRYIETIEVEVGQLKYGVACWIRTREGCVIYLGNFIDTKLILAQRVCQSPQVQNPGKAGQPSPVF